MIVTVFGGAQPKPGSDAYLQAYALGSKLAKNGHTVVTGGYMGTMEAISAGAASAGGHVIGITCTQIENWRNTKANPWVKEEHKAETLTQRLEQLIDICDAAIALPGGPGTMTEIALMWNMMVIQAIPPKKLFLVGEGWKATLDQFSHSLGEYSNPAQLGMLSFAPSIESIDL